MKTILSLFATFFLLINPIYSQQYKFNKSFVETLKTGALKPNAVENLTIANLDRDEILLQSPSNPSAFLDVLKKLTQLKVLQFENLQLVSSRDTLFLFSSQMIDSVVNLTPYGFDLSPYSILPLLEAFEELEILELNFLDSDGFTKACKRDFSWAVLCEDIEQEMILELFDCRNKDSLEDYKNLPIGVFSMWNWTQKKGEELLLVPGMIDLPKALEEKKEQTYSHHIEESIWEWSDTLSDEAFCEFMPEFCDDSGLIFEMDFDELDTAFLKEIGNWPLEEEGVDTAFLKLIGEWPFEEEHCLAELKKKSIWKAYQEKCEELYELYWIEKEGMEALYQKLSVASQTLVDAKTALTLPVLQQASQRSLLIQKLYYKELWETLRPWNVKTRSDLFLEQLGHLKKLRKLSISNNYMLDFESLIDFIAKELPNLEVLEFKDCKLSNIPENINQLQHLTVLNLNNNFIHNASIIQLPNLAILSLEGNQIIEQEIKILKDALPNCSLRF